MKAVILAGGKGTRLKPYTTSFPKPLMPVGDRPIIEIVIGQLAEGGFDDITIAVGHLAELITTFLGDGSKHGVSIKYHREEKPMGTAGPLRDMRRELDDTFLLMNGDVLSDIDLKKLVRWHKKKGAMATVVLARRKQNVDYGTVEIDRSGRICGWVEKPDLDLLVSTGIYVLEPEALKFIPSRRKFDFPDLVKALMAAKKPVHGYVHEGYWLDIGRPDDYQKACDDVASLLGDGGRA